MRAKLTLYNDEDGKEVIAIITHPDFEKQAQDDGMKIVASVMVYYDFISWPTDRYLQEEK